jgi:hypothetical protein
MYCALGLSGESGECADKVKKLFRDRMTMSGEERRALIDDIHKEIGEVFSVETWFPRRGPFHRRHMAMEQAVFQAQERISEFESFRTWTKIGAGFVDWLPGPGGGGVIPIPRSISYRALDEEGMREFHEACLRFWRGERAQKVLWPHLTPDRRAEMMETVLGGFEG